MLKKHKKFFSKKFLKYNIHQEEKDLSDPNVIKMLVAFDRLRKDLKNAGFNVGRMYAMPSMVHDKDDNMYFGKLETDAECVVWMIREYFTVHEDGTGWDTGGYCWKEAIYSPPGILLTVKLS